MQEAYSLLLFPIHIAIYILIFRLAVCFFLFVGGILGSDQRSDHIYYGNGGKQNGTGRPRKT